MGLVEFVVYRGSTTIRRADVRRAVKVPEIPMGWFAIRRCELVRKRFRSNSVDADGEIAVGDRRIASFDGPQWFAECPHRRRRVEDDLCAVYAIHHPILRVVPSVAYVNGYAAPLGVEYWVTQSALHVVGRLYNSIKLSLVLLAFSFSVYLTSLKSPTRGM